MAASQDQASGRLDTCPACLAPWNAPVNSDSSSRAEPSGMARPDDDPEADGSYLQLPVTGAPGDVPRAVHECPGGRAVAVVPRDQRGFSQQQARVVKAPAVFQP